MSHGLYPLDEEFAGERAHREGAAFDFRANLLTLKGARSNKGIAVHELMHFFEHCSTPFGAFQDEMHERTSRLVFHFLRDYPGPVPTPIYPWIRGVVKARPARSPAADAAGFDALVDAHIRPWSQSMHLWHVLDGRNTPHVRAATAGEVINLLRAFEGDAAPAITNDCGDEACPLMQCDGTGGEFLPIGAHCVSECMAQIQEGLATLDPDNVAPEYVVLLLFGNDLLQSTARAFGRRDRDDLATLLAVGDLSLFTPIGSIYHPFRPADAPWSCVHPGWRFCKALERVAAEDWWITSLYEAEDLGGRVTERLGWPSPRSLLEAGAGLPGTLHERHRRACQIRLEDFMAFYRRDRIFDLDQPVGKFLADHMPTTYYPGTGTVCNVPVGDNAVAFESLKRCVLVRRYVEAMLRPMRPFVLPPGCDFEMYFADVRSENDLTDAIVAESPWLDPARFDDPPRPE